VKYRPKKNYFPYTIFVLIYLILFIPFELSFIQIQRNKIHIYRTIHCTTKPNITIINKLNHNHRIDNLLWDFGFILSYYREQKSPKAKRYTNLIILHISQREKKYDSHSLVHSKLLNQICFFYLPFSNSIAPSI